SKNKWSIRIARRANKITASESRSLDCVAARASTITAVIRIFMVAILLRSSSLFQTQTVEGVNELAQTGWRSPQARQVSTIKKVVAHKAYRNHVFVNIALE